jgi:hypothetical protein
VFSASKPAIFGRHRHWLRNFKDDFELDRHSEWKTRDANDEPNRRLLTPEDFAEQIGRTVCDSWLVKEISRSGYEDTEPDDARDSVE